MENKTKQVAGNSSDERREAVNVHLTDVERIEFQKAAERCGMSLEDWMRDRLRLAVEREAKDA